jgi:hypothetical protein
MKVEEVNHAAAFWTMSDDSRISRVIARLTDGPFSHMGVAFYNADGDGVYFESLMNEGFVGPRPVCDLLEWGKVAGHHLRIVRLPYPPAAARAMYTLASSWTQGENRLPYPRLQLVLMGFHERWRIPIPEDARRAVCSEAGTRLCLAVSVTAHAWGGMIVDFRDRRRRTADMVNPNSAWRRMCEMQSQMNENAFEPGDRVGRVETWAGAKKREWEVGSDRIDSVDMAAGGVKRGGFDRHD